MASTKEASLTACFRINNLLKNTKSVPFLGQPILRAIPHPSSLNPSNPDISQLILSYSLKPDESICICFANGPLDKLLAHKGFKKHVNDHVRDMTRYATSPCVAIEMFDWHFTEYVLGPDGKGSVVHGGDTKNLSPLVREAVQETLAAKFPRSVSSYIDEATATTYINPDRSTTTSVIKCTTDDFITPEIRTTLHGKYEEFGHPVFRRISDPKNPGVSQIKMNFSKIPSDVMQLSVGFSADGEGDGGERPGADDEQRLIKEVTRQVMGVLLGEDDGELAAKRRKRRRDRAEKRGDRESTTGDVTGGDEVDQEIEAVAVRSRYWNCHRGGDDGLTKEMDSK